jgi:hypothetical protein
MSDNFDRIYDILLKQGDTLARIDQSQQDTRERLFGANGQPGTLHFLQTEIAATNIVVEKHGKTIAYWKGALALLTVLWTGAVAVGAAIMKHR